MPDKERYMGKWIVIGLLVGVLSTVGGMWFMLNRANERLHASMLARGGSPANAAQPTGGGTPAPGAKMVEPESLPQGFIVVVTDRTRVANSASPIYMPSSHNGWNPGDTKMRLEAQSDMKWRIVWEKPTLDSRIAFKFARGAWEKVEVDKDFKDIDNRTLPLVDVSKIKPGEKPVIELEIANWIDQKPGDPVALAANRYRPLKVGAGSIERLEVTGGGVASLDRDLLVWLPPGYHAQENSRRAYPVLYMQDGQNLFEPRPGLPAEWGADETAAALIEAGKIEPLIIVGIPNSGALRMQEYLPVAAFEKTPARGAEYVEFVVSEVMPRVERAFRVKTGAQHSAIGGASLGGVIALAAATKHPGKFGMVLAESTPLVIRDVDLNKRFGEAKAWPSKVYFGMGTREGHEAGDDEKAVLNSTRMVESARAFEKTLGSRGLSGANVKFVIEEGAIHNEVAWAKRFGPALEFLFPVK